MQILREMALSMKGTIFQENIKSRTGLTKSIALIFKTQMFVKIYLQKLYAVMGGFQACSGKPSGN